MFNFLIPTAIFSFGGYFLYKVFELYGMRNERKTIIDRLDADGLNEYVKRMPIGVGGGNVKAEEYEPKKQIPARWALRLGLLIIGFGAGLVLGSFLATDMHLGTKEFVYNPSKQFEAMYVACVCICTGVGLLLSFVIETLMAKRCED